MLAAGSIAGEVALRVPQTHELRACRMLLPQVERTTQDLRLLVGVDGQGRVVAAGALGCRMRERREGRWHLAAQVVAPLRRRGIGRRLVRAFASMAHRHGIPALYTWDYLDEGSDAGLAVEAMGFTRCDQKYEFRGSIRDLLESTGPLLAALEAKGRIPPGVRVVPLKEADPHEVALLHTRHLGGSLGEMLPLLHRGAPGAFNVDHSVVMLHEGRVVGCVLGRGYLKEGLWSCDAVVVDPSLRRGFASLLIRHRAAEACLAAGYSTVRFHALPEHRDTQHVSARLGAALAHTSHLYRLDLSRDLPAA